MIDLGLIPIFLVMFPLIGIGLGYLTKRYSLWAVVSTMANLVLTVYLFKPMSSGKIIKEVYNFSVFPTGLYFKIDLLGYIFLIIVSFVWTLVTIYSLSYMEGENRSRYYIFLLATLSSMMGIFVTGDFFSLLLFFEMMTISSYVLVVHNEDEEAHYGGNYYLYMGIGGGMLILWGAVLTYGFTGSVMIESALFQLSQLGVIKYVIAVMMIVGFGVKAGMFPVHIWLPKAHPVAPSPASALLSGIIIKAGIYGILRVVTTLYWPMDNVQGIITLQNIGFGLIIIGAITMFSGMICALFQWNVKRILAYSSVSQMGYILMGIGVVGYLGMDGTLGFAGAVYHIINHALFKSSAFLIIGAICFVTHEMNLKKLSGMGRNYPVLMIGFIVTLFGISGIPGFNGYASKTLIHHSLLEAFHLHHSFWILTAEKVFIITSAGTLCYFLKIFYYLFIKEKEITEEKLVDMSFLIQLVTSIFAICIFVLGLMPELVTKTLLKPLYQTHNLNLTIIKHIHFWSFGTLWDSISYLLFGIVIFILAVRGSWFEYSLPKIISIERVWSKFLDYYFTKYKRLIKIINDIQITFDNSLTIICNSLVKIDRNPEGNRSILTIQSIDFSKLVVALMLVIVLLWFIIYELIKYNIYVL
ncbi:complex I subunit 5 family protein [Sporohalobacter salinus]|uniref:complex I subunit 5 family protein n=1 Tax=Sporohalobacter salinus TaxID=1494606 RepID=UPI00195F5D7E|nr:proton-conducting transporter membrane subunit [Sporohalobacter salinus]MBM7624977.1 formate hydrogenlyase subunit 3/multisubunit Na+/H+ antiporter MnhD subunit [Sporohalobacter salinus]